MEQGFEDRSIVWAREYRFDFPRKIHRFIDTPFR